MKCEGIRKKFKLPEKHNIKTYLLGWLYNILLQDFELTKTDVLVRIKMTEYLYDIIKSQILDPNELECENKVKSSTYNKLILLVIACCTSVCAIHDDVPIEYAVYKTYSRRDLDYLEYCKIQMIILNSGLLSNILFGVLDDDHIILHMNSDHDKENFNNYIISKKNKEFLCDHNDCKLKELDLLICR